MNVAKESRRMRMRSLSSPIAMRCAWTVVKVRCDQSFMQLTSAPHATGVPPNCNTDPALYIFTYFYT